MKEQETGIVKIENVYSDVMEIVLKFIYQLSKCEEMFIM